MELELEQTQQSSSHEVSVSTEGVEELKRIVRIKGVKKEALHTNLGRNWSQWIYPLSIEVSCVRFYCLGLQKLHILSLLSRSAKASHPFFEISLGKSISLISIA
nr:hypothetical protein [Tanacetum cinerariifolium]